MASVRARLSIFFAPYEEGWEGVDGFFEGVLELGGDARFGGGFEFAGCSRRRMTRAFAAGWQGGY